MEFIPYDRNFERVYPWSYSGLGCSGIVKILSSRGVAEIRAIDIWSLSAFQCWFAHGCRLVAGMLYTQRSQGWYLEGGVSPPTLGGERETEGTINGGIAERGRCH